MKENRGDFCLGTNFNCEWRPPDMLERKVTFLFCIIKYENFLTCSWLLKGDTIQGAVLWRTLGSKKMEKAPAGKDTHGSTWGLTNVQLLPSPWTVAHQDSLSLTISWSLPKFMSIALVMSSNHLNFCNPLLLPSLFPSIRVFSSELAVHIT